MDKEYTLGMMEGNMQVDSSLAKCMAMENYCMKMEDLIKVSIMKIRSMVKAYILGLMGKFMMEAGKMVKSMELLKLQI